MINRRQFLGNVGAALLGAPLVTEVEAVSLLEAPVVPVSPPSSQAPSKDSWTRLDDGTTATSLFGSQFTVPCLWGKTGDVWAAWNNPTVGARSGTFMFRRKTNKWDKVTFTDDIRHNISNRENYGSCYDPDGDRIWIGNGAPASMWNADCYFDPNTNTYTSFGDFTGTDNHTPKNQQLISGLSALRYWRGALYSIMNPNQKTSLRKMTLPYSRPTEIPGSAIVPWSDPRVCMVGQWRAGLDSRTGQVWAFGDSNELYIRDLVNSDRYVHIPTFGTRPPMGSCFCLLEALNVVVAWCGQDFDQGFKATTLVDTTYVLDLGSLFWRIGPSTARHDAAPKGTQLPSCYLMNDELNKCVIMTATGNNGMAIWRLDIVGSSE